ncbi:MAG: transposase [Clostridia bacterium]|nr:transposase [Clostridia bacterium]
MENTVNKCITTASCLLLPNTEQKELMDRWFFNTSVVWNMILADKIAYYEKHKNDPQVSNRDLNKVPYIMDYLNRPNCAFLKETDFSVYKNATYMLQSAFDEFLTTRDEKLLPRTKEAYQIDCMSMDNNSSEYPKIKYCDPRHVYVSKIGELTVKEYMPLPNVNTIKKIRIKKTRTGKYFLDIIYEKIATKPLILDEKKAIGLDYSPYRLYIDSNGHSPEYTGKFPKLEKKRKLLQRKLSETEKGSANQKEIVLQLAKVEEKIINSRKDFLRKEVHKLLEENDYIFLETVSMEDMALGDKGKQSDKPGKGRRTAVYNAAFDHFRSMLEHQALLTGKVVSYIPAYTKTTYCCHVCGKEYEYKSTKIRGWTCPKCGTVLDRDVNAAINIRNIGLRQLKTAETSTGHNF